MRVSEMFIASILEEKNGRFMDEGINILELDEKYHNLSIEKLKESLSEKNIPHIICQENKAPADVEDMKQIHNKLVNRVISF